jgi:hypothetical protein
MPNLPANLEERVIEQCLKSLRIFRENQTEFRTEDIAEPFIGRLVIKGPWGEVAFGVRKAMRLSPATTDLVIHQIKTARRAEDCPLLLTDYVPQGLAAKLIRENLSFVDAAGNAFINQPPLYIEVTGHKRANQPPRHSRAFQPAGLKIVYHLLKDPDMTNRTYRDISKKAGVALGAVGPVLKALEEQGYLRYDGPGNRRLTRGQDLLNRWELGYSERLRPKLLIHSCRLPKGLTVADLPGLVKQQKMGKDILLGGELGAALLTDRRHCFSATLHLFGDALRTMLRLRLVPHPAGNVELLQVFGGENAWAGWQPEGLHVADPLLMHAELVRRGEVGEVLEQTLLNHYVLPRLDGKVSENP